MGLSDPAVQPLLGNGSANIKLVKNGENQLRKAAEQGQQDPNKNLSPAAVINLTSEKLEVKDPHPQESSGCEILPSQPRRTKSFLNYYADLETSARELGQNLGPCQGVGEEKAQPGPGQAPVVIGNGDLLPQKPNKPQSSPEDGQVATVSSSPETKKDHPKTGAKTDCALHRIQNLAPSDEESSWFLWGWGFTTMASGGLVSALSLNKCPQVFIYNLGNGGGSQQNRLMNMIWGKKQNQT